MFNRSDIQLSKALSWLLRHGANTEGIAISPEGYIDVDTVLQHRTFIGKYSRADVERVVANNNKQRFKLRVNPATGKQEIKANQGHSLSNITDEELIPIVEGKYETVVHGSYLQCWPEIRRRGLSRMTRRHIHLATGTLRDGTVVSGLRPDVQLYIFVDINSAIRDGVKFYQSENGVVLTPGNSEGYLEPKYFVRVVRVQGGGETMEYKCDLCNVTMAASSKDDHEDGRRHRTNLRDICKYTVRVTGFPTYTQSYDLLRAYSSFGVMMVRKMRRNFAMVAFARAEDALAAVQSPRVNVYAHFLTSFLEDDEPSPSSSRDCSPEPYPADLARLVVDLPHRGQPPTPRKPIIGPEHLDLSGEFSEQVVRLLSSIRLTRVEVESLHILYTDLENVLRPLWPGCVALPFGSITTGLGIKSSDADCFVAIDGQNGPSPTFVTKTRRILEMYPDTFTEIVGIPRANTPIVKFYHIPTAINCDVSFKTALGTRNSRLVRMMLLANRELVPLALVLKYWAHTHGLSGSGRISNYTLTLMLIFYLQRAPPSLPAVRALQPPPQRLTDGWNAEFTTTLPPLQTPTPPLAEMLGGFFRFYAQFPFEEFVVCPYLGETIPKRAFRTPATLPDELALYRFNVERCVTPALRFTNPLCVQDPLELCHNVASCVSARLAAEFRAHLRHAALAYERCHADSDRDFLAAILQHKPDVPRKVNFRHTDIQIDLSNWTPLTEHNWRACVRAALVEIFEKIFRMTLAEVPAETGGVDPKRHQEKLATVLEWPVWRRKKFDRPINFPNLPFLERQAKITQEVLNAYQDRIHVELRLSLAYVENPRKMIVKLRYGVGNMDAFRDFCRYCSIHLQQWVKQIIKPNTAPKFTTARTFVNAQIAAAATINASSPQSPITPSTPLVRSEVPAPASSCQSPVIPPTSFARSAVPAPASSCQSPVITSSPLIRSEFPAPASSCQSPVITSSPLIRSEFPAPTSSCQSLVIPATPFVRSSVPAFASTLQLPVIPAVPAVPAAPAPLSQSSIIPPTTSFSQSPAAPPTPPPASTHSSSDKLFKALIIVNSNTPTKTNCKLSPSSKPNNKNAKTMKKNSRTNANVKTNASSEHANTNASSDICTQLNTSLHVSSHPITCTSTKQ